MYKKRIIQMLSVLILLGFFCYIGQSQTKNKEQINEMVADVPEDGASEEEKISEEKVTKVTEGSNSWEEDDYYREEVDLSRDSAEREYRAKSILIWGGDTEDAFNENIVGYTLQSIGYGDAAHYYQEPDWVLPEELAGKGVYVSEHMCETEVFLGRKLATLLADRGVVREVDRQYYTDWAVLQLKSTDWKLLDMNWEPDPFAYGREYWTASFAGQNYYSYLYHFYPKQESAGDSYTQMVTVRLLVDKDGVICGIVPHIYTELSLQSARITESETGLCDEHFRESLMVGGSSKKGKTILDFSKYYQKFHEAYVTKSDTNVTDLAEKAANMFIDMLESRGEHEQQYRDDFADGYEYEDFADLPWDQIEENWKAEEGYNCEYVEESEYGNIKFCYCFFPDYEKMGTDIAQAVAATCDFGENDRGILCCQVTFIVFYLSREGYLSREKTTDVQVVKEGEVCDVAESISVSVPQTGHPHVLVRNKNFDGEEEAGIKHEETRIWGYSDVAGFAGYLGEKLQEDIKKEKGLEYGYDNDSNSQYKLRKFFELTDGWDVYGTESDDFSEDLKQDGETSGWHPGSDYDCFYVKENERAGCIHLRYYFYPQKTDAKSDREWVLVLDAYVSEEGVEALDVNSFARIAEVSGTEKKNCVYRF